MVVEETAVYPHTSHYFSLIRVMLWYILDIVIKTVLHFGLLIRRGMVELLNLH